MPDYRERKRPPMTKKQIMIQMTLCVAILAFFAFQEAFFPTDAQKKASPAPTVSAQAVLEASGAEALTAEAVEALPQENGLQEASGDWKLYIQPDGSYVLLSPDVEANAENMSFAGYELGQSVKAHVADSAALSALMYKVPAGGSVAVAKTDGSEIDATAYASLADVVRKAGFKDVKLASQSETP